MSLALLSSPQLRSLHTGCALLSLCALSAVSCGDLEGFTSKPGEAYCGTIGLKDFQEGFIEEGEPSSLELALVLDTSKLPAIEDPTKSPPEPGRLHSNDPQGMCGTPEAPQVLFLNAPMRAIPKLQHDVLSALTFGEGHDHDFFAWVDSTCQGTMLAVVSLMKNNYVELRLFKPARLAPITAPAAEQAGFALFHLDPKPLYKPALEGGCGFPPPDPMLVLGIETSCDETAAALVTEDGTVVSDSVHSQIKLHAPYGGVVPELASRDHLRNVRPVVREVFRKAGLEPSAIDGIAVTCRPGLTGALLVGVQAAKGLAFALEKPLVGVDHLVGHLLAVFLKFPGAPEQPPAEYPFVALLASGGHTAVYRVAGPALEQVTELGATRDDAAGECFDKVGKLLGLGYPGGPLIDKLAKDGNPDAIELPWPMRRKGSLEFSFSGLKSNMLRWVDEHGLPGDEQTLRDVCAAFQRRVVDTLIFKTLEAARAQDVRTIVLAGGVAANRELRERSAEQAAVHGIRVVVPPFKACTDNASMIAYAGIQRLLRGENDAYGLLTSPHTSLPQSTKKGRGKREN